jgi:hypothetical protein
MNCPFKREEAVMGKTAAKPKGAKRGKKTARVKALPARSLKGEAAASIKGGLFDVFRRPPPPK